MKKKSIQIEIPQPCHEKWNDMTPVEKGNFCGSCQKVVVDFSAKTDREIGQFFKQSKGNLCGRFHPTQLNRQILIAPTITPIHQKAWAAVFTGLLLTAGVTAQTNPTVEVTAPRPVFETQITGLVVGVEAEEEKPSPQQFIKGIIIDKEIGEPLLFANVVIYNASHEVIKGVSTDFDGRFEIKMSDNIELSELILEVSYVGYETKQVAGNLLSDNMTIGMFSGAMMGEIVTTGIMITHYQDHDQTLWQSGRRLWNRLQYNNPIRTWIENRQEKKALKAQEKAAQKEVVPPTIETINSHTKTGKLPQSIVGGVHIQTTENPAFVIATISPNPFQSQINLDVEMLDAGELTMSLFTEDGKRVYDRTDLLTKGTQQIQLDMKTSNLVAGTYILNIFHENGFQKSEILIFQ